MQLGLNKLPWYGQVLLFAIIGGGGIFSYHYFYGSNLRTELAQKTAQLAREHVQLGGRRGGLVGADGVLARHIGHLGHRGDDLLGGRALHRAGAPCRSRRRRPGRRSGRG